MKTLLPALNAAAEVMRQAAVSEAAVLRAVADQLARLGLRGGVSLLDEAGALTVRAAAFPTPVLAALEKLTGLKTIGYTFSPAQVDAYRQALETGQAVFVPDGSAVVAQLLPESARRFLEPIIRRLGRDPAIIAPLIAEGQRLGALSAVGPDLAADDAPAIMALADHTAIALANARGREREAQHVRRLSAFNTVALALNNSTDLEEALRLALRETLAALDLPAGWISLRGEEGFRLAVHQNLPPALAADDYAAMRRQPCRCQRQLLAGELSAAVNMLECERLLKWAAGDTRGLRVHAAIPIRSGDQILGVLNLALPPGRASFDEDDLTMLSALGHQLGVTLARARLHAEMLDSLRREQRLNEIARLIGGTLDEPTLLQTIVRLAAELIGAQVGAIALVSKDGRTITYPYLHNLPAGLALEPTPKGRGLAWRIVETGETILLADYAHHPNALPQWVEAGVHAFIGVPIVAGEARLGALGLFSLDPAKRFTERDAALAETVGRQAGVAIQNARLFKARQWRVEALTALHATGLDLSAQHDLPRLLRMITQRAAHLLEAPMGGLYLLLPDGETLELVVSHNLPRDYTGARLRLGEGLSGRIAQTGEPIIVEDYSQWEGRASVYADVPFAAVVGAPIKWRGEVIGVINVTDAQPGRFHAEDAEMLTLFADQAAVAIANARLLESERRRARHAALLNDITRAAVGAGDLEAMLQTLADRLGELLDADGAFITLWDEARQRTIPAAAYGDLREPYPAFRPEPGEVTMTESVLRAGHTLAVEDVFNTPYLSPRIAALFPTRSMLALPLIAGGRKLGAALIAFNQTHHFTPDEVALGEQAAGQIALAVARARLFEETRRRAAELEALAVVSSALRQARTVEDMLPVLAEQAASVVGGVAGVIFLIEPASGDLVARQWRRVGAEGEGKAGAEGIASGQSLRHRPGEGIAGHTAATGEIYITQDLPHDPLSHILPGEEAYLGDVRCLISLPLRALERTVGVLQIGLRAPHAFREEEIRLLTAVAEMGGNALHRATLHEQTEARLERLTALRAIDMAISASLDLHVTLNILLAEVTTHLHLDAASVLLLNPRTQMLEYAVGRGFRSEAIARTQARLGEGHAGRAALERRIVHVANLPQARPTGLRTRELTGGEAFVTYYAVPLVAKGEVKGVLEIFHRAPLEPDPEWLDFMEALGVQAAIAIDNAALFDALQRSNIELTLAYDATIEGWSKALDLRDKETEGHTRRVTEEAVRLARALGMSEEQLVHVRRGALLHDIGKMGIPDSILLKPGPFTREEVSIMRFHPTYAYDMLSPIAHLRPALDIPYCHHEKWDGTGYPRGLKGEQIPLAARLFAVVDVWDALTSDRPYRPAWPKEKALAYIREQAGRHFDPRVVEMFLKLLAEGKEAEAEGNAFGQ